MPFLPSARPRSRSRWLGPLGWITGVLSVLLGAAGFAAVLCLWFPSVLTTPELREIYDMTLIRGLIKAGLLAAFLCGAASLLLKRRKALGLTGIGLAGLATLMGGSQVEVSTPVRASDHLGLDWFLLNLLILATVFVPLEHLFARLPAQRVFRKGWTTDLAHFGVSHLLVQATVLLTLVPAAVFFLSLGRQSDPAVRHRRPARAPSVRRDPPHRRSHPVHDPSPLSCRALALALPPSAPFGAVSRLARRLAAAPRGHRGHARRGFRARLRAWIRHGPHLRVPGLRVLPGHLDPREREFPLRSLTVGARHAAVPPLAPQRRVRSGGQEFRRALARDRSRLRDLPSARQPVARPLRPGGRSCPRELCSAARLPVPSLRSPSLPRDPPRDPQQPPVHHLLTRAPYAG